MLGINISILENSFVNIKGIVYENSLKILKNEFYRIEIYTFFV